MSLIVVEFNYILKKKSVFLILLLFVFLGSFAQTLDNPTASGNEMLTRMQGAGVTLSNPVFPFSGAGVNQYGTFSNGLVGNLNISNGVVFTTGNTQSVFKDSNDPSDPGYNGQPESVYLDMELGALKNFGSQLPNHNPAILEFKLHTGPNIDKLIITYQFASEEYPYYVCARYNDVFGFFIKGGAYGTNYTNIAKLPSGDVVSINTVHALDNTGNNNLCGGSVVDGGYVSDDNSNIDHTNSFYYVNNSLLKPFAGNYGDVQVVYDGLTKLISSVISGLTPDTDYTFKIAIADTGDSTYDSAVFINEIRGMSTNFDGDNVLDDTVDLDDDNDGIIDTKESNGFDPDGDEDGDSLPNFIDVLDNTPGNGNQGLTNYLDANGDGTPDNYDLDNDGKPNHLDLDSDGDGCWDVNEQFASPAADGDGNGFYGNGIPLVDAQGRVNSVVSRLDINYLSDININVQANGLFVISSQPINANFSSGGNASFSVASSAVGPVYKWQKSVDSGISWTDLSDGGTLPHLTGVNTDQLSLNNIPSSHSGFMYRVLINTGNYSCFLMSSSNAKLVLVDPPPTVNISVTPIAISENAGMSTVTATLSTATTVDTNVTLNYAGTAISGGDYTAASTTITILAGQTTGTTTITAINDGVYEVSETVIVAIASVTGGNGVTENGDQQAIVTIVDSIATPPTVNISVTPMSISENAGVSTVTATLSAATTVDTNVALNYAGTAISGGDYTAASTTITILAGQTTGTTTITAINDGVYEVSETVIVAIASVTGGNGVTENGDQQAIVTIVDSIATPPMVNISVTPMSISENAGVSTVTATLSAATTVNTIVNLNYAGTAMSGGDYVAASTTITILAGQTTGTTTITAINDGVYEVSETVILAIASVTGGNGVTENGDQQAIVTIVDSIVTPPMVNVSVTPMSISENAEVSTVTATLSAATTVNTIVNLNYAGTAMSGGDYAAASSTIIILAGQTTGTTTITAINDGVYEVSETVIVAIASVTGGNGVTENGDQQATVTIVDSIATPPMVNVSVTPIVISENAGVSTVTATLSAATTVDTNVALNYAGTAMSGGDYAAASTTITILAGQTTGTTTITAINDGVYEGSEDVIIGVTTVSGGNGATIGAINNPIVKIIDINAAPLAINDDLVTSENVSTSLNVCINDSDVDGLIDVATVDLDLNTTGIQTNLTTSEGNWSVDNLGVVIFVPTSNFIGVSTILYTVKDNFGLVSNVAEIKVVVKKLLIIEKASVALVKTGEFNDLNGDGSANVGETITYSFTVTNTGDVSLANVSITDSLPGVVMTNAVIALNSGESDSSTFKATYSLTQADIIKGNVTNQATVVGTSPSGLIVRDLSDDSGMLGNNPTVTPISGCVITVFNSVTPEGPEKNKGFFIRGIDCYPDNRLEVFNRWGVLVYESDHYDNVNEIFNGISQGHVTIGNSQVLPVGTYFYSLKYKDSNSNAYEKSGYLYLNRN